MLVKQILYHPDFIKDLKRLDHFVQLQAVKTEELFRDNPLHPSVRLHPLKGKLKGLWSISVTLNVRIIFKRLKNGELVFLSIGRHDIYKSI